MKKDFDLFIWKKEPKELNTFMILYNFKSKSKVDWQSISNIDCMLIWYLLSIPKCGFIQYNIIVVSNINSYISSSSAFGLRFIVQRTKQCLDFAATVHLIHFICCWSYNSRVPHNIYWWVTNIISLILMTVIGEFLCLRSEMKAIPVSMGPKADL